MLQNSIFDTIETTRQSLTMISTGAQQQSVSLVGSRVLKDQHYQQDAALRLAPVLGQMDQVVLVSCLQSVQLVANFAMGYGCCW